MLLIYPYGVGAQYTVTVERKSPPFTTLFCVLNGYTLPLRLATTRHTCRLVEKGPHRAPDCPRRRSSRAAYTRERADSRRAHFRQHRHRVGDCLRSERVRGAAHKFTRPTLKSCDRVHAKLGERAGCRLLPLSLPHSLTHSMNLFVNYDRDETVWW